jgi:hypothetical protein
MIMPETRRENRHRADTAQRKTCQTVQKPDINNNSFPSSKFANQGHGNFQRRATYYWYFTWLCRDAKAGAGTKMLLALPELGLPRGAACQD